MLAFAELGAGRVRAAGGDEGATAHLTRALEAFAGLGLVRGSSWREC